MKTYALLTALAFVVTICGCYYDNAELLYPYVSTGCDTTNVTFATSIQPILQANCWSCHSNANAPAFGNNLRFESYADVRAQADRILHAISHDQGYSAMPKDGSMLSACALGTFRIWVRNGAPAVAALQGGAR